jgi:hypothetical protein
LKNKYLYIVLALITIFSLLSILISSRTVEKIHKENIEIKERNSILAEEVELLNKKQNLDYNSESRVLSNLLLVNWDKDSIPLKQLIDKPKLIYRFYKETCAQCYEDELDILKKIGEEIGENEIFIISDMDLNELKAILIRKGINSPFFKYKNRFNIPFDQKEFNQNNIGTFFILDTGLKTDLVYIAGGRQNEFMPYFQRVKQYFITRS